ncbi:MAG: dihydropteroate synthase [Chloroflexota bacterium]
MQTILRSKTRQVSIDHQGTFTIIGEKINPTGRKKLATALQAENWDFVREQARLQVDAGADVLDVNVGVPGLDEVSVLPRVVRMLADEFDVPLALDTANPAALAAALPECTGKALVNSVTGEEASLTAVLPLVKEFGAAVIALTMDKNGIPQDAEGRVAIAGRILERAARSGIPAADVIIDPLVLTVGAESNSARVTLQTIQLIQSEFGVNINVGASNVSYGLPERDNVNLAFLALAISAGASCAITDSLKYCLFLRAVDLLRGRDSYAMRYLKYYRAHPPAPPPA